MVPEYAKLWQAYRDLSDRIDGLAVKLQDERAAWMSERDALRAEIALLRRIKNPVPLLETALAGDQTRVSADTRL